MNAATDQLIERLARDGETVRPLRSPVVRATLALIILALLSGFTILMAGDITGLRAHYAGRETLLAMEMLAMLSTAIVAVLAAFFASIPGRSRRWLAAPVPFLLLWFGLSGAGCLADLSRAPPATGVVSGRCLLFIFGTSAALAPWLIFRLARARPIEPLPVALLGGLGIAATSAFILQFFHAPRLTMIDLLVHIVAVASVVGILGLLNRPLLARP